MAVKVLRQLRIVLVIEEVATVLAVLGSPERALLLQLAVEFDSLRGEQFPSRN